MHILFNPLVAKEIEVFLKMMRDFYILDNYEFIEEKVLLTVQQLMKHSSLGVIYLIHKENSIVGYLVLTYNFSFEYNGQGAFVDELFIKEKYRNKGIGKKAIEFAYKQALSLGKNALQLEVEKHNEIAIELYRKCVFKVNDRILMAKTTP